MTAVCRDPDTHSEGNRMKTETVLQEAARIIDGQRTDDYGDPEDSFSTIARYWTTYLNDSHVDELEDDPLLVTAGDVAHMMALLKLARVTTGQPKRDSYVDLAGYAALAARINDVDTVPVESLVQGQPDTEPRIPKKVRDVKIGRDVFTRSMTRPGSWWNGARYWPEPELYEYATKNNMEVEYL